jgi:hypothetical protein
MRITTKVTPTREGSSSEDKSMAGKKKRKTHGKFECSAISVKQLVIYVCLYRSYAVETLVRSSHRMRITEVDSSENYVMLTLPRLSFQ